MGLATHPRGLIRGGMVKLFRRVKSIPPLCWVRRAWFSIPLLFFVPKGGLHPPLMLDQASLVFQPPLIFCSEVVGGISVRVGLGLGWLRLDFFGAWGASGSHQQELQVRNPKPPLFGAKWARFSIPRLFFVPEGEFQPPLIWAQASWVFHPHLIFCSGGRIPSPSYFPSPPLLNDNDEYSITFLLKLWKQSSLVFNNLTTFWFEKC